jgi:hypothetical protein
MLLSSIESPQLMQCLTMRKCDELHTFLLAKLAAHNLTDLCV